MKKRKLFQYFQPNPKDLKDRYGDCAVRALCAIENMDWLSCYDKMWELSREVYCPFNSKVGFEHIVKSLGYKYTGITNKKDTKRPTVEEFAKEHKTGKYILVVANHYVAVKEGMYWDTWNSGNKSLYGYWEKAESIND